MTFLLLLLAYPGIALKILQAFKCQEIDGVSWLVADMRLQCYTAQWAGIAAYAGVYGLTYVVGLPLYIACKLFKKRHLLFQVVAAWSTAGAPEPPLPVVVDSDAQAVAVTGTSSVSTGSGTSASGTGTLGNLPAH